MRDGPDIPLSQTTYKLVDAPLYCVLTRVRLRRIWHLPRVVRLYLQVRRAARPVQSLKRCAFLLENLHTFFILSIWEGEEGYAEFGTVAGFHIKAANQALVDANRSQRDGALEIWSTEWTIRAMSHNLNWNGWEEWYRIRSTAIERADASLAQEENRG